MTAVTCAALRALGILGAESEGGLACEGLARNSPDARRKGRSTASSRRSTEGEGCERPARGQALGCTGPPDPSARGSKVAGKALVQGACQTTE